MGYYRGDHYRGDYYRGDPGFFSFIGGALKGLVSGIGKVASFVPGPIGIAGKALTVLDQLKPRAPGQGLLSPGMPEMLAPPGVGVMAPGCGIRGSSTQPPLGTPAQPAAIAAPLGLV